MNVLRLSAGSIIIEFSITAPVGDASALIALQIQALLELQLANPNSLLMTGVVTSLVRAADLRARSSVSGIRVLDDVMLTHSPLLFAAMFVTFAVCQCGHVRIEHCYSTTTPLLLLHYYSTTLLHYYSTTTSLYSNYYYSTTPLLLHCYPTTTFQLLLPTTLHLHRSMRNAPRHCWCSCRKPKAVWWRLTVS